MPKSPTIPASPTSYSGIMSDKIVRRVFDRVFAEFQDHCQSFEMPVSRPALIAAARRAMPDRIRTEVGRRIDKWLDRTTPSYMNLDDWRQSALADLLSRVTVTEVQPSSRGEAYRYCVTMTAARLPKPRKVGL